MLREIQHPHPRPPLHKPPKPTRVGVRIEYRHHKGKKMAKANGYCAQPPASAQVSSITFAYTDTTSGVTLTNTLNAPFAVDSSGNVNDTAGFPCSDGDTGTMVCDWDNSAGDGPPSAAVPWTIPTPVSVPPVPTGVGVNVSP
jgi:hypothetical protein